jgi:sec-independent protein translocase protein TatA
MGIFGNTFGLPHLIIILVIILLLFGAPKLPGLARSVGQSMKIFRNEIKDPKKADDATAESTDADVDSSAAPTKAAPKTPKSS